MRKHSDRNNRVSMEVQRELSNIIRNDVKDPRIHPIFSLTDTYVAPDLKTCKAYVSVMGTREELEETLAGLKSAEGYIRRQLAHNLNLRNTPVITFIADTSIAYGVEMTHRLEELVAQIPDREDEEETETEDE